MKANNHAIVILYRGKAPNISLIESLADFLVSNGITIPELLTIQTKDNSDILNCLAESAETTTPSEEVKNAVIYIGERFKRYLKGTGWARAIGFSIALTSALRADTEKSLTNAVHILANADTIPAELTAKYGITEDTVKIIRAAENEN